MSYLEDKKAYEAAIAALTEDERYLFDLVEEFKVEFGKIRPYAQAIMPLELTITEVSKIVDRVEYVKRLEPIYKKAADASYNKAAANYYAKHGTQGEY